MAKTRHRSPAYPAVNLNQAIAYAQTIYAADRRNLVPVAVVASHLGYVDGSSQGARAIAALKQFGLLDEEGKKEDRRVRLTPRALDILLAPADDAPARVKAIREAALEPTIHTELWDQFHGELPSDANLRSELVRNRDFNDNYVDRFIRQFRDTIEFARLLDSDIIRGSDGDASDLDSEDSSIEEDESPPPSPNKGRLEKNRKMSAGLKEDVFSLDEGAVVVQWPETITGATKEDIDGWLKLVASKIKRAVNAQSSDDKLPSAREWAKRAAEDDDSDESDGP